MQRESKAHPTTKLLSYDLEHHYRSDRYFSFQEDHAHTEDSQNELGLANVGGVFVVLVLGCTAGFIMAVMEFLWNIRKIAVQEKVLKVLECMQSS